MVSLFQHPVENINTCTDKIIKSLQLPHQNKYLSHIK